METQGQLFPEWLKKCDVVTFSPKPPSSGNVVDYKHMIDRIEHIFGTLPRLRKTRICIKVVVFTEADYQYALEVYKAIPRGMYDSFYFTAGTKIHKEEFPTDPADLAIRATERILDVCEVQRQLADRMLQDSKLFDEAVHIGCQQHVLLWPEKEQGV